MLSISKLHFKCCAQVDLFDLQWQFVCVARSRFVPWSQTKVLSIIILKTIIKRLFLLHNQDNSFMPSAMYDYVFKINGSVFPLPKLWFEWIYFLQSVRVSTFQLNNLHYWRWFEFNFVTVLTNYFHFSIQNALFRSGNSIQYRKIRKKLRFSGDIANFKFECKLNFECRTLGHFLPFPFFLKFSTTTKHCRNFCLVSNGTDVLHDN